MLAYLNDEWSVEFVSIVKTQRASRVQIRKAFGPFSVIFWRQRLIRRAYGTTQSSAHSINEQNVSYESYTRVEQTTTRGSFKFKLHFENLFPSVYSPSYLYFISSLLNAAPWMSVVLFPSSISFVRPYSFYMDIIAHHTERSMSPERFGLRR